MINTDIKLKELDQLHNVTMEFNKNSIEIKKVFITLIIAVPTIMLNFSKNLLILCFLLFTASLIFWIVDSQYYFFQHKIRLEMKKIKNELENNTSGGMGIPMTYRKNFMKCMFNLSNSIYILVIINILLILIIFWIKKCFF